MRQVLKRAMQTDWTESEYLIGTNKDKMHKGIIIIPWKRIATDYHYQIDRVYFLIYKGIVGVKILEKNCLDWQFSSEIFEEV